MRTTLDIDEDVLSAAKELARSEGRTAGAVVSDLVRRALTTVAPTDAREEFYGFVTIPSRGGIVTRDLVQRLVDEDDDR